MLCKVQAGELPVANGLPLGRYTLVHSSPTYGGGGYQYQFENGKTIAPVEGRALARLLASNGGDYTLYASDEETVRLVADHVRGRNDAYWQSRADEILTEATAGQVQPEDAPKLKGHTLPPPPEGVTHVDVPALDIDVDAQLTALSEPEKPASIPPAADKGGRRK